MRHDCQLADWPDWPPCTVDQSFLRLPFRCFMSCHHLFSTSFSYSSFSFFLLFLFYHWRPVCILCSRFGIFFTVFHSFSVFIPFSTFTTVSTCIWSSKCYGRGLWYACHGTCAALTYRVESKLLAIGSAIHVPRQWMCILNKPKCVKY